MEMKRLYEEKKLYLGKEIEVKGWVRQHRKQKEIGFIELSDGTCFKRIQVVYEAKLTEFEEIKKIKIGSALSVLGKLDVSPVDSESLEIHVSEIVVVGDCEEDYPIQPKRHTREFLREQAYLRPRTTLFQAVFRVRSVVSMAIHEYFQSEGFLYLHAPIFTASDCEGAGDMFQVTTLDLDEVSKSGKVDYSKDFFGKKVGLSVSTQFEAETFAQAFSKVYTFGPTFRADKSHTPYHLAEFWQVEPEVAFCDLEGIMSISEDMMKHVIKYVLEYAKEEMEYYLKVNQWLPAYLLLSNYSQNVNIHTYDHILRATHHTVCQNDVCKGYPVRTDIRSHVPSHGKNGSAYSVMDCLYIQLHPRPWSCGAADRSWKFRYHQ